MGRRAHRTGCAAESAGQSAAAPSALLRPSPGWIDIESFSGAAWQLLLVFRSGRHRSVRCACGAHRSSGNGVKLCGSSLYRLNQAMQRMHDYGGGQASRLRLSPQHAVSIGRVLVSVAGGNSYLLPAVEPGIDGPGAGAQQGERCGHDRDRCELRPGGWS